MATRNIVPRATGEGSIGTTVKRWLNGFFDNITLGRVSVNNNEASPIDDNAVNLGAALKRWMNGFFAKVTTQFLALSSGGEEKALFQVDPSNGDIWINNLENSGRFTLTGKNSVGEDKLMIHSDPDAGVYFYNDGENALTILDKSVILHGLRSIDMNSSNGSIVMRGSPGGWAIGNYFRNPSNVEVGVIGALGDDAALSYLFMGKSHLDTGLRVYPDGATILYHNNVQQLATTANGIYAKASDHSPGGSQPQIGNTVYGTGSPPSAGSVPEGTVFYKYIP